jgi:hypothetical protein
MTEWDKLFPASPQFVFFSNINDLDVAKGLHGDLLPCIEQELPCFIIGFRAGITKNCEMKRTCSLRCPSSSNNLASEQLLQPAG